MDRGCPPRVRRISADDAEPMSTVERNADTTRWISCGAGQRLGGVSDPDAAEPRLRRPGRRIFSGCAQFRTLKPIIFTFAPYGQDIDDATGGTAGYMMARSLLG